MGRLLFTSWVNMGRRTLSSRGSQPLATASFAATRSSERA
jgi:hypothetical protein